MYDYRSELEKDIRAYIDDNYDTREIPELLRETDFEERLYDELFIEDNVTGNASGSYYCNTWKAEEAICHNLELLGKALEAFGCEPDYLLTQGAEAADVTIRCYLLGEVLSDVLFDIDNNA